MTTFELFKALDRFVEALSKVEYLTDVLGKLRNSWLGVLEAIAKSVEQDDANRIQQTRQEARSRIDEAIETIRQVNQFELASARHALSAAVERLQQDCTAASSSWAALPKLIDDFTEEFVAVTKHYARGRAVLALKAASHLADTLQSIREVVEFLKLALRSTSHPDEVHADLEVEFTAPYRELAVIVAKLRALSALYEELCRYGNVSPAQEPLTVVRLEIGSTFLKVRGNGNVTRALADVIKGGARYLYETWTLRGRIDALPKDVAAVEEAIKLRNLLEQNGLPTDQLDKDIASSAAGVGKNLSALLGGEPALSVNGEHLSAEETMRLEARKRLELEYNATKLLEDKSEESDGQKGEPGDSESSGD